MGWSSGIGWLVFIVGAIAGLFIFNRYRKLYPLFYLISLCIYIFTIAFAIDVFNLGRSIILLLLALSAVVFLALGFYLSRILPEDLSKKMKTKKK
jgi:hypothetical protein